jgi:hypothetical protein
VKQLGLGVRIKQIYYLYDCLLILAYSYTCTQCPLYDRGGAASTQSLNSATGPWHGFVMVKSTYSRCTACAIMLCRKMNSYSSHYEAYVIAGLLRTASGISLHTVRLPDISVLLLAYVAHWPTLSVRPTGNLGF